MIDKILNTPLKYMYKYNLTISTYDEQNLWDYSRFSERETTP